MGGIFSVIRRRNRTHYPHCRALRPGEERIPPTFMRYHPCSRPTMFFIGVTTGQSSINRVFPRWAAALGLGDCELRGMDFPLHAEAAAYREAAGFIKSDPLALGALVTTHKMDLFAACRDQFDEMEPLSAAMGEVSSLYKRSGQLHGRAVDPWTAGTALEHFLPPQHWQQTNAEVLILGAGGSAISLAWHLCRPQHGANRPRGIHVANRSTPRLAHLEALHTTWQSGVPLHCHHVPTLAHADALCAALPAGSMVVNATGLGKDAPGSPLTDAVRFPRRGLVWEFNYRGNLVFLEQARAQEQARGLTMEDGWVFFLHGWTRVIADVFHKEIPASGPLFDELSRIAAECR